MTEQQEAVMRQALVDDEGENRAVRTFLDLYGGQYGVTTEQMRKHHLFALEQPAQQEPDYTWPTVADYETDVGFQTNEAFRMAWNMARTTNKMMGITSPPAQRTWQGLTDEEIENCYGGEVSDFARAIEAKLKEKNQ
jgi:hypothetical protein